ncbi:MAG: GDP-mannose 4,6-dehydratase [Candidatus Omnitrophica bacterium]|nr:GDP-mannose 4,6-dehydratase [Candidatus Omnitrophota bacterium]
MFNHKTVLVTGAAGFIGANLVYKLASLNNQIHIFVKKSSNLWRLKNIIKKIKIHYIEFNNTKQIERVVQKINPEIIYHLAAHGAYSFQTNQLEIIKTNIFGTAKLLTALNSVNYQCFVNTGSSSEYGFKNKPMKETDLLEPNSFYAATKAAATYLCGVFGKNLNKPIVTLRPFSVYGPYEEPARFIPTVITNIIQGKPIKLTAKDIRRDFIYIDDVIDCYLKIPLVINKKIYGEVFNIGTGQQYSNDEVANLIIKIMRKKAIIKKGGYQERSWDTNFWVAETSKANEYLKWKAKYQLEDGLTKTVNWFKNYENFESIYCQRS